MFGGSYWDSHYRGSGAGEIYGIIKRAYKLLDGHEMVVQRNHMFPKSWFSVIHSVSNNFFGLFSHGLTKACRCLESVAAPVNRWEVSKFGIFFISLPEKVNEILSEVMAFIDELTEGLSLIFIKIVEVDAGRPPHGGNFELFMGFNHDF